MSIGSSPGLPAPGLPVADKRRAPRRSLVRRVFTRIAGTIGKAVLFNVAWLMGAVVPVAAWEEPSFLAGRPAWLRLYWEVAPLALTVLVTYAFVVFLDKRRVRVVLTLRPFLDTLLGLVVGSSGSGSSRSSCGVVAS